MPTDKIAIDRAKTALSRRGYSTPMKHALDDGLIGPSFTVLDYGCGRGDDVSRLRGQGISCTGWDPNHHPDPSPTEADVVNLGYVINVIEDTTERQETLRRAWQLARRVLIVAAQVQMPGRGIGYVQFGDGLVSTRGTFQKFYAQSELKEYLEIELETQPIPATVGVFYLFKDETTQQQFLANKYSRRVSVPRLRVSEQRYEENKALLNPFIDLLSVLGRVPDAEEYPDAERLSNVYGSLTRAFALVRRVTGEESWSEIARRRREDLLVFLALARFRKRPPFSGLPATLQRDIRAFFGNYTKACQQADDLLFTAGNADAIDLACQRSSVGKLLPNALYVHRAGLDSLEPILRIYEGCARAYVGQIEGANLIKLHRFSGKVSYLVYPDFEKDPHPALQRSVKLSLRTRELDCLEYSTSESPPILHRKETFLPHDHPLRERFARLTQQEERNGLLDDAAGIGTRQTWKERLDTRGFTLRGHSLIRKPVS
jgi:DNA phosphorothioation-associated putative methyltransferase